MHLKRWLTSIIALPLLIYVIGFGPAWVYHSLIFLVSVGGLKEFYRMTAPDLAFLVKLTGYLFTAALFLGICNGRILLLFPLISFLVFIPMTMLVLFPGMRGKNTPGDVAKGLMCAIYLCLPLGMLVLIHRHPQGDMWTFFLLAVIFSSDTGAFYCGKLFGNHKLHKALSPGKTWEGAIGGAICSIIAAAWFLKLLPIHEINMGILLMVIGLSIVEQLGDLAESMLKRNYGVKDSGAILPGHGGILDRIDGLLFAIPVFFVYFLFTM